VLAYWRERFPLPFFLPVAIGLALAAQHERPAFTSFAADASLALLLLALCRLWDDLADRGPDAARHPERVLVRARRTAPFAALCVFLAIVALVVVMLRPGVALAASALGFLYALLATLYAFRTRRSATAQLLLLTKYPAFVLIVAAGSPDQFSVSTLMLMLAVFVAACAYEGWHDDGSPLRNLVRLKKAVRRFDFAKATSNPPKLSEGGNTFARRRKPDATRSVQWQ
jgi:4-hydroxybenzoate polyprenyltransferase